jgi:hypothetical protein
MEGERSNPSTFGNTQVVCLVPIHEVCCFGERSALFDPDDGTAHDVFDGHKVGCLFSSYEFPHDIRFRDDADDLVIVEYQHASDIADFHQLGSLDDRGVGVNRHEILLHELTDRNLLFPSFINIMYWPDSIRQAFRWGYRLVTVT